MFPGIIMGYVSLAGGGRSDDLLISDCEDLETLSTSEAHAKILKFQEVSHKETPSIPCADGTIKILDLLRLAVVKKTNRKRKNRQDQKRKKERTFGARVVASFTAMTKFIDQIRTSKKTFPVPTKYVDENKHRQCLRDWIGTTSFQILRIVLPEGYTGEWYTIWFEEWSKLFKKQQDGRNRN